MFTGLLPPDTSACPLSTFRRRLVQKFKAVQISQILLKGFFYPSSSSIYERLGVINVHSWNFPEIMQTLSMCYYLIWYPDLEKFNWFNLQRAFSGRRVRKRTLKLAWRPVNLRVLNAEAQNTQLLVSRSGYLNTRFAEGGVNVAEELWVRLNYRAASCPCAIYFVCILKVALIIQIRLGRAILRNTTATQLLALKALRAH